MNISETVPMERRRAIVVGAAGGIGSDICRRMALEGYRVVVADYNEDRAREVLRTLAGEGHDVRVFDGTKDRAVDAAFDSIERSEEHTSELQSQMRLSYAGVCLKNNMTYNSRKKT